MSPAPGSWTLSREVNGRLLVLRPNALNTSRLIANIPTRTFAKIAPEKEPLNKRNLDLILRLRGETVGNSFPPLTDRELAALTRAIGDGPEAKRLFCRDWATMEIRSPCGQ
jgi:hypothetical protein